jgi:hypothetical protein
MATPYTATEYYQYRSALFDTSDDGLAVGYHGIYGGALLIDTHTGEVRFRDPVEGWDAAAYGVNNSRQIGMRSYAPPSMGGGIYIYDWHTDSFDFVRPNDNLSEDLQLRIYEGWDLAEDGTLVASDEARAAYNGPRNLQGLYEPVAGLSIPNADRAYYRMSMNSSGQIATTGFRGFGEEHAVVLNPNFDAYLNSSTPLVFDDIMLGDTLSFEYWFHMDEPPPVYEQGLLFDVVALQAGAGWEYLGQTGAYESSTDWQQFSLDVPEHLRGTTLDLRFILNDLGPVTNPWMYVRGTEGVSVPEPGTLALFAAGLLGVGIASRRRRTAVGNRSLPA